MNILLKIRDEFDSFDGALVWNVWHEEWTLINHFRLAHALHLSLAIGSVSLVSR